MISGISNEIAQQIVDTVKEVCGKNINFISPDGNIIASTDEKRIGTFHEIGEQTVRTGKTLEVAENNEFQGANKGVNVPILYKEQVIAAIGISGEPAEVRKYAYLAQKIAGILLKERELDALEHSKNSRRNYYVQALVHGRSLPQEYIRDFLKEYGYGERERFRTVVFRIISGDIGKHSSFSEQKIIRLFERCGSKLYTFEYPSQYILLVGESKYKKSWKLIAEAAAEWGENVRIAAGSVEKVMEQRVSYEAAELVLKGLQDGRNMAAYEDMDIELLLGSVPPQIRESYKAKILENLDVDDRKMLKVYFAENLSLAKTGEVLNIHKNTLQYRLDRISRRCGYNPRVFQDAAVLYHALKL